jgi:hypothetical protein
MLYARVVRWSACVVLLLSACRSERGAPAPEAGAAPPVATASAPATPSAVATSVAGATDPTPDPITHPCVVTSVQFDMALENGEKGCASDADCECIPPRIGEKFGCGGVTSKKTGAKLRALAAEFSRLGCKDTHKCKQTECRPRCAEGQCR